EGRDAPAARAPLQPGAWFERATGVLLHITSLPGGTLGRQAHGFVDFIAGCGFDTWQTLPLSPVNATRSPYQPLSLLAGNTALIDTDALIDDGLLPHTTSGTRENLLREAYAT